LLEGEKMEFPEIAPISDLRVRQSEILAQVEQAPVVLTQHGRPAVVLVHPEEWKRLQETLEDLEDSVDALIAKIELLTGQDETMPWEEVKASRSSHESN
jgi:prevent-host-death family protein